MKNGGHLEFKMADMVGTRKSVIGTSRAMSVCDFAIVVPTVSEEIAAKEKLDRH